MAQQENNYPAIAADAIRQAKGIYPDKMANSAAIQGALVAANVIPRLIVPALKQVSGYEQQPRFYTHAPATLAAAAGSTVSPTINYTANADFLWTTLSVIVGPTGKTDFDFDVQIVFGGNDRQMSNVTLGIHPFALMGADRIPFLLPKAFVMRKRDTIQLTYTRRAAVEADETVQLYMIGIDYMDANVLDGTRRVV